MSDPELAKILRAAGAPGGILFWRETLHPTRAD
jgi:hypothetical protein